MIYLENCGYSVRLINKLKEANTQNQLDFKLINKAIYWAKKYHGEQKRKSGEPYYTHPLEVAYLISDYNLKTEVIAASILHDIIEDTEVTLGMILDNFGWRIAEMVDRLTRDRPDGSKISVEEILNNAYKIGDKEVLLIKVIDRLHNLSTLSCITKQNIKKQVNETYDALFPGITATISFFLEKQFFLALKKEDTECRYKEEYNVSYHFNLNFTDFQLPCITLNTE
jgi:(p)ppGpp synthase/HD superfamily hydrolase